MTKTIQYAKSTKYAKSALFALVLMVSTASMGAIQVHEFRTPQDEKRYQALIEELRCPKCQNQNLAGSDAPIAVDLKNQTYQMIMDGRSDAEIRQFMFDSYGDFISYKPPMRPSTWILWLFPPIFCVLLMLGWVWHKTRKGHLLVHEDEVSALSKAEQDKLNAILKQHQTNHENKQGDNT